jgi:peptidoglycan/LPS O-acetylase OafA/YrhL
MKKFDAIEGLRGWLAWAVVFSHLAYFSDAKGIIGLYLRELGLPAVLLFLIISGFVITHLIIERPEPYSAYLVRRFMRLFPLFAVTCVLGYFANDLQANLYASYGRDPAFRNLLTEIAHSDHEFFWQHLFAHTTLFHGAISDAVLPFSQYAFNMPAWSISLEWQFYLLAPIILKMLLSNRNAVVWMAVAVAIAETAYRYRLTGTFAQPSFLPGIAGYFAVGIASRIIYPSVASTVRNPATILAIVIVVTPLLNSRGWPLLIWVLFFTGLVLNRLDPKARFFSKIYELALESQLAIYFGSRSFSTYLSHVIIITICYWFWVSFFPVAPSFFRLSALAIPLTVIAAELLYRYVEQPGIALGSNLVRRYELVAGAEQARVKA